MTRKRAGEYLYDLWSEADFIAKSCDDARSEFARERYALAIELLDRAKRSASLLEMRIADCVRAVESV